MYEINVAFTAKKKLNDCFSLSLKIPSGKFLPFLFSDVRTEKWSETPCVTPDWARPRGPVATWCVHLCSDEALNRPLQGLRSVFVLHRLGFDVHRDLTETQETGGFTTHTPVLCSSV
ncbi:uncharacterized [Tachysurus ichikawai]